MRHCFDPNARKSDAHNSGARNANADRLAIRDHKSGSPNRLDASDFASPTYHFGPDGHGAVKRRTSAFPHSLTTPRDQGGGH